MSTRTAPGGDGPRSTVHGPPAGIHTPPSTTDRFPASRKTQDRPGNLSSSATLWLIGAVTREIVPCQKFEGVTEGEPTELGSDADGTNCVFAESDITFQ
ncbi:hypothetical protein [Streptomyces sp. SD15]